jgi:hypothetical protein
MMRNSLEQSGSVLAGDFYEAATTAYDQILSGERQAKDMMIALQVLGAKNGMGGVLLGPPGVGKSMFMDRCHETIDGYGQDQVAEVPHRADLTGAKLIGEYTELEKTEVTDGHSVSSTLKANVMPILHQGIKVVKFDEINRRFMTLASAISSPHPTEILAGCGTQELKYENNVLKATIKFEIHLPQKSVSIDIQISVPEGEAVDPELRFVNIGGHAITLSCNKDSEEMIIEELRCLMMRSDKMIFSL